VNSTAQPKRAGPPSWFRQDALVQDVGTFHRNWSQAEVIFTVRKSPRVTPFLPSESSNTERSRLECMLRCRRTRHGMHTRPYPSLAWASIQALAQALACGRVMAAEAFRLGHALSVPCTSVLSLSLAVSLCTVATGCGLRVIAADRRKLRSSGGHHLKSAPSAAPSTVLRERHRERLGAQGLAARRPLD
jgi:hypothetical protein